MIFCVNVEVSMFKCQCLSVVTRKGQFYKEWVREKYNMVQACFYAFTFSLSYKVSGPAYPKDWKITSFS